MLPAFVKVVSEIKGSPAEVRSQQTQDGARTAWQEAGPCWTAPGSTDEGTHPYSFWFVRCDVPLQH